MINNKDMNKATWGNKGFTLVELLVVITILGILATIGLETFASAQARGRDAQRKSDLKETASSLEIFYNDYHMYPASTNGEVVACPYPSASPGSAVACVWGQGEFADSDASGNVKTIYFKTMPKDPSSNYSYYYRPVSVNGVPDQGFQLFAQLENTQDPQCYGGNCGNHVDFPNGVSCGNNISCNFSITSANVNPISQ